MKKIKFIDLFSGMGGLRLGFEQAMKELDIETECLLTSEIKSHAISTLEENFDHKDFRGDITKIDEKTVPDFDVLLGGFPCQAFSFAGSRKGFKDTRGTLFFDIERILKEKKPTAFILENVEGLIRHDYEKSSGEKIGKTFNTILNNLKELGYHVDWKLIDSSEIGVPQKRKRVFIIGNKNHPVALKDFNKKKTILKDVLIEGLETKDTKFSKKLLSFYSPEELFGKRITDKRGGNNNIHSWDFDLKGKTSPKQKRLASDLLKARRNLKWADIIGIHWMDGMPLTAKQIHSFATYYKDVAALEKDLDNLVEKGYLAYEHPKDLMDVDGINKRMPREDLTKGYNIVTGKLSFEYNQILSPKGLAPTLVATDLKKIGVIDKNKLRPLSIKEVLGLFGYPKDYVLSVDDLSAYDLLGNTVVVPVVKEVAKKIFIEQENDPDLDDEKHSQLSLF